MTHDGRCVAIVHARGGSRRIPLKNLREVAGKPLLAYPIELCQRCRRIDRVIVSSDHDEIMRLAAHLGAEVPFRRPADISEDVPSELVTLHALRFLEETDGSLPDLAITITPATPLTTLERLEEGFALLDAHPEWDTVTTVRRSVEHPEWMVRRDPRTEEFSTILGNPLNGKYNVSQHLDTFHYPTGAFWINRVAAFLAEPNLYGQRWGAIELAPEESVDIDWPEDLEAAAGRIAAKAATDGRSGGST